MADLSEIKKLIREIVGDQSNLPIPAIVRSIEGDSCTVELSSGLIIDDVKLKATITEGDNYMRLIPKVNTKVLLLSLSGDVENIAVIKVDQAQKFEYSQEGLKVIIDSEDSKVTIQNGSTSLKQVFEQLADLLKEFKVNTPSGPSTNILPDTLVAILDFQTKFNQILKDV